MERNHYPLTMLGVALTLSAAVSAAEPDWPCWRGPNRDGRSPDTGLVKQWPEDGPPLVWNAAGIGHGFATVSIGWGTIYTTGDVDGKLRIFALGLDGKPKWQVDHDDAWATSNSGFAGHANVARRQAVPALGPWPARLPLRDRRPVAMEPPDERVRW